MKKRTKSRAPICESLEAKTVLSGVGFDVGAAGVGAGAEIVIDRAGFILSEGEDVFVLPNGQEFTVRNLLGPDGANAGEIFAFILPDFGLSGNPAQRRA